MIFLDNVHSRDTAMVQNIAATTKIENDIVNWDCQDYVLEMLEKLEEECIVEVEDETYKDAKKELMEKFGPRVSFQMIF